MYNKYRFGTEHLLGFERLEQVGAGQQRFPIGTPVDVAGGHLREIDVTLRVGHAYPACHMWRLMLEATASVVMTLSMVASEGASMPAPLVIPPTVHLS